MKIEKVDDEEGTLLKSVMYPYRYVCFDIFNSNIFYSN